jgi:SAM-dependent methyltransferase
VADVLVAGRIGAVVARGETGGDEMTEAVSRIRVACPVCGERRGRPERTLNGYALVRCRACGLVYVNPQPTAEELHAAYADRDADDLLKLYAQAMTPARAAELDAILAKLERLLPTKGKLLDFGCGAGYLVERALRCGWDAHGLEAGKWAKPAAEARGVATVHVGSLGDGPFPAGSFEVVTAKQVLEHVPDLKAELSQIREALRPGGLFYADVPNYRCLSIVLGRDDFELNTPPQHLNYFTPKTLTRLLKACGFDVLDVETFGGLKWENLIGRRIDSPVAKAYREHDAAVAAGKVPTYTVTAPPPGRGVKRWVMPLVRSVLYRRAKVGMTLAVTAKRGG